MYRKNLWAACKRRAGPARIIPTPSITTPSGICPNLGSLKLKKYWWISPCKQDSAQSKLWELALPFLQSIMFSDEDGSTVINSSSFVFCSHSRTVMPPNPQLSPRENHSAASGPGRIIPPVLFSTVPLPARNPSPSMRSTACFPLQDRFQPSARRNSELHHHPIFDIKVFVYLLGLQGMVGVMLTSGNKMLLSLILSKA